MSKLTDAYICPHCGKRTVSPVNHSGGEFLAIHKLVYGTDGISSVRREIPIRFCTQDGTKIIDGVIPAERLSCDLEKPTKPISDLSAKLRKTI